MIQEKAWKQKIRKGAYRYTNIDMTLSINVRPRRKASARAQFDSEKLNCYLLTRNFGRPSGKEAEAVDEERAREHHKTASIEELAEKMPKEESFGQVASVFQQISDCTRLRILWLLCHTTASVGAIARAVGMSDSAVSHHLRVLRADGKLQNRRRASAPRRFLCAFIRRWRAHADAPSFYILSLCAFQSSPLGQAISNIASMVRCRSRALSLAASV